MTQPLNYATPPIPPAPPSPLRSRRPLIVWVLIVAVVGIPFIMLKQQSPSQMVLPLSTFYAEVQHRNVSKVVLDGDEISGKFRSPVPVGAAVVSVFRTYLPADVGHNWMFTQWLLENSPNADIRAAPSNGLLTNFILPFIPWLLILAFIWFFVFRQLRRNSVPPKQPIPVIIVNPERT